MRVDQQAFVRALAERDPIRRGLNAMEALRWPGPMAKIEWQNGNGFLGHLILESFPTSAAVFAVGETSDVKQDWKRAWLNGARWCLSLHEGHARWYDLQLGRQWSWSRNVDSPLQGFTPNEFLKVGRFEPRVDSAEFESAEAREHATAFLVTKLFDWWNGFLLDLGSPREQEESKESFARMLSAILLLRTIEDLGVSPVLQQGQLRDAARALQRGNERPLQKVFGAAADKFQSVVLRTLPNAYFPPEPLARALLDTYELSIDFSDLNVDPVGQFYEQVLGTRYELADHPQTSLFHRNATVSKDTSARREGGVYYTPRVYADSLALRLVRPLMRAAENLEEIPVVVDIACGSGELLCSAFREMLTEPKWRRPEIVKHILAKKIYGIDLNGTGRQLTALNLLRTAVRMVPDLIVDHLPLPSMEETLHQGDSLRRTTLAKVPPADVAILNPPFHGARRWAFGVPERELPSALRRSPSRPNQAFAMLVASLHVTRAGGRIGCVFPSQLMSGVESASWRQAISAQVSIEAIIENYGNPFPDVQSYAGLIWGRKRQPGEGHPRARIIRVDGAARFQSSDMAAVFAGASQTHKLAKQWIRNPIAKDDAAWMAPPGGEGKSLPSRGHTNRRIPVTELTGGHEFHQAPVPAPEPWRRGLFFFEPADDGSGGWKHLSSGAVVRGESSSLRPIAMPNYLLSNIPQFCEPSSKQRIFLPGDGSSPVSAAQLSENDPVGAEILRLIRAVVQTTPPKDIPQASREFVELVRREQIGFWTRKSYIDVDKPLIVASKATRSEVGKAQGLHWSCWLNEDGAVVPLGGIYCRVEGLAAAVALACWMNTPRRYVDIFETAAHRNLGTRQPSLTKLAAWLVPALDEPRLEERVALMMEAFGEYRRAVRDNQFKPEAAALSAQYGALLASADALWV